MSEAVAIESPVEHKRVSLDLIINNPDNYNVHPADQIHDLKQSLRRFGQIEDSVVRKHGKHYMLVAGEGITTAARELIAEDPTQFAHLKEWNAILVPAHWTERDARAYLAASNELARKSSPDTDILAKLLKEQQEAGFDLAALGSDDETLRQLLQSVNRAHATDFLNDILHPPQEDTGEDGEEEEPFIPSGDAQYFAVSYALTAEQRTTVLTALKKAKKLWEVQTSQQALVLICQHFSEEHPNL